MTHRNIIIAGLVWASVAMVAAAVVGCRKPAPQDEAARPRIVSFSPAFTSMVFDMGLGDHVVGVTAYCQLPSGQSRPVLGNLQQINPERFIAVNPDMVLIQQNPKDFEAISRIDPNIRIEHFTIETLTDIGAAMHRIGALAGNERLGLEKKKQFEDSLSLVTKAVAGLPRPRVLFLTAADPPSIAGRESFIHQMIELAGGQDVTAGYPRWTQINVEQILMLEPEVIVCQTPPDKHRQTMEYIRTFKGTAAVAHDRIFLVSDPLWTIPSPGMARLAMELARMIHPEIASGESPK